MKRNSYLDRLRQRRELELNIAETWAIQSAMDCAVDIMNSMFGIGRDRLAEFNAEFQKNYPDYRRALTRDPEADYFREKIDQRQKEIYKEKALPWEDRYDGWKEFSNASKVR